MVAIVPSAFRVTMSNSRTCVAVLAPFDCTAIVRFAMLRRKRLRPCAPTYAAVAAIWPGSSRCTEAVYWYTFSGRVYSFAYARGWYDRLFGLLLKFARNPAALAG